MKAIRKGKREDRGKMGGEKEIKDKDTRNERRAHVRKGEKTERKGEKEEEEMKRGWKEGMKGKI